MHSTILLSTLLLAATVVCANDSDFRVAYRAQSLTTSSYSSMQSSLTGMLAKLTVPMPPRIFCANCKNCAQGPCLVSTFLSTQVKPFQGKTTRAKLDATLKSNRLPVSAINKIKAIIFSESVVFQTFESRVNVNAAQGILLEVVGAARRSGETVEFGVLQSNIKVRMVGKTTTVKTRKCKRFLFIKKCKNRYVQVARGYSAPELSSIERLMLSKSNQLMKTVVKQINVYSVFHGESDINRAIGNSNAEISPYTLSKNSKKSLRDAVISFVDRFPYLKELLEQESTTTNVTIQKITNRGFMTFSRSATLQAIDNVDPAMYDQFVTYALRILSIKSNKVETAIKKEVFDMVPMATNSDWILYRILFQEEEGGQCKYVCVLGHNNLGKGYDFVFATFGMKFELAPDILVIEESKSSGWGLVGSSKTRIVEIPASIKYNDVDTLFKFFDLAAFTRFAKMLNVAMPTAYVSDDSAVAVVEPTTVIAAVQAGVKLWGSIAKTFKTKITNKIVDKIVGEGFSHFFMNSVAHRIEGLQAGFLSKYLEMAPGMYDIPEKYKGQFRDVMLLSMFTNSQQWNKHDMLFDTDQVGSNRWITMLSNRDDSGNYNFLIVNVKQKFTLAPDILVIEQSKSKLGGIYESTKIKFQKMPRNLTEKDMKQLFAFFTVVSFQRFAASVGITIPNDPIIGQ